MPQPRILKSNTRSKLIYRTSDDFGTILVVDSACYRVLNFDSEYEQSGFYLEKPYKPVHEYVRIMLLALGFTSPKHVTLLGLGGGSLLRSLHFLLDECQFHAVELRQKVLEVAKQYFDIPCDLRVRFSVNEAQAELNRCQSESTDIIFSDLYDASDMCSLQVQQPFLLQCERVLSKQGWLVINFHRLPDRHSQFFTTLGTLFLTILTCASEYNSRVVLACKAHVADYKDAGSQLIQIETLLGVELQSLMDRIEICS